MTAALNLDTLYLDKGAHDSRDQGVCFMEAVAWYHGDDHSDAPPCVSPVLRILGTRLNDILPDERRQELKQLIPVVVGTTGDGHDEARSYMALDWLIRTYTPTWLDLAGLTAEATALRDLRRIVDLAAAQKAGPVVRRAQKKAATAGTVAWYAVRTAAWDAAGTAAWYAAGAAAWYAAWDAAGDAARTVAEDAARTVAGDATGDAARAALQPTVDLLQTSAIDLYRTMVKPDASAAGTGRPDPLGAGLTATGTGEYE